MPFLPGKTCAVRKTPENWHTSRQTAGLVSAAPSEAPNEDRSPSPSLDQARGTSAVFAARSRAAGLAGRPPIVWLIGPRACGTVKHIFLKWITFAAGRQVVTRYYDGSYAAENSFFRPSESVPRFVSEGGRTRFSGTREQEFALRKFAAKP